MGDLENLRTSTNTPTDPEINVKNAFSTIRNVQGDVKKFKCTEFAISLGWPLNDWLGTPIIKLMSENEIKDYEDGKLKWGSFDLEAFLKSQLFKEKISRCEWNGL
ncbi:hypothetical protein OSTOST_00329 [Ostertagia ostertagi]